MAITATTKEIQTRFMGRLVKSMEVSENGNANLRRPILQWRAGLLIVLTGCSSRGQNELAVFAAASLTEVFTQIARDLEADVPGLAVQLNFAGSQQLATQIEQGAQADVYATANKSWMDYLIERKLVGAPSTFASNELALVTSSLIAFDDIAQPGMQIVVGASTVPVGEYTRIFLDGLEQSPGYGPMFVNAVRANIVSEEDNVRSVLAKVLVGEADVAFVYRTDLSALTRGGIFAVPLPTRLNVSTQYLVAPVTESERGNHAASFIAALTSPAGQAILREAGFSIP